MSFWEQWLLIFTFTRRPWGPLMDWADGGSFEHFLSLYVLSLGTDQVLGGTRMAELASYKVSPSPRTL